MSATGDFNLRTAPEREAYGFTLLEVLVVIAVLALVAGLVFPRVDRTLEGVQFASARSMVSAAAQAARSEAVRSDTPVVLQASIDGRSLLSNGRVIARLPPSVRVETRQNEPRFFGDGSSSGGALGIVAGRSRAELQVVEGTGIVRWLQ